MRLLQSVEVELAAAYTVQHAAGQGRDPRRLRCSITYNGVVYKEFVVKKCVELNPIDFELTTPVLAPPVRRVQERDNLRRE